MSPSPRKRARAVVFTLVAWVLIVVAAETVLRIAGFGRFDVAEVPEHEDIFRPDAELIWALKPDWRSYTNSLGMRGPEPRLDAGSVILFLGDSVTYGHALDDPETVPSRLEARLAADAVDVAVLNAGVPGYSTFQAEAAYRRYRRDLALDGVLLGFCLNDVTERYLTVAEFGGARIFMSNVDTDVRIRGWRRAWRDSALRDAVVSLVRDAARRGERYRVENLWETPEAPAIGEAWERVFGELDRLVAQTAADGVPLGVVIYPYRAQLEVTGRDAPQRKLVAALEARGVGYIDLLDSMRSDGTDPAALFLDDNHLSVAGAELVAIRVAEWLEERWATATPDATP